MQQSKKKNCVCAHMCIAMCNFQLRKKNIEFINAMKVLPDFHEIVPYELKSNKLLAQKLFSTETKTKNPSKNATLFLSRKLIHKE